MARTLEEMDRALTELQTEVATLKQQMALRQHPVRALAGCFTGDEDFARIMDEIEEKRKIPDPGFPEDVDDVAA